VSGAGGQSQGDWYEVRVRGHLDRRWSPWLDGLDLLREPGGTTLLRGRVVDQAALFGLLNKVRDLGLPLISLTRVEPAGLAPPPPFPPFTSPPPVENRRTP
jgi:hypothetical protein